MATQPIYPVLGIPSGMKQAGKRVDFKPNEFDFAIETKGYLLAWERATVCPCAPVADQTKQPDPSCALCDGTGWFYFGAPTAQDLSEYTFDTIQQAILTDTGAMVIRGIITNVVNDPNALDKIGNWVAGTSQLTVRNLNKLGYYDRVTALDADIVYAENLVADGSATTVARYRMTGINYLRSVSTVYVADTDYELSATGQVTWLSTPPVEGTRLVIHYHCHPVWVVMTHPHTARVTSNVFKIPLASRKAPTGNPRDLPTQALVRYEFLPDL